MGEGAIKARESFNAYGAVTALGESGQGIEDMFAAVVEAMANSLAGLAKDAWERAGGNIDAFIQQLRQLEEIGLVLGGALNQISPGSVADLEEVYAIMGEIGTDALPAFA